MVSTVEQHEACVMESREHIPVMRDEVRDGLRLSPGAVFVDCTLGLGGHAGEAAKAVGPSGRVIGIDRDASSLEQAARHLASAACRKDFVHDDFRNIDSALDRLGVTGVDGILLDLGISSFQLDDPRRGFSIRLDGPLDMRMDQKNFISAYDLVNSLSEREISIILKKYGEERWHHRIARLLVEERLQRPIATTRELSHAVLRAIPSRNRHQKIHPATRTFQAFRIAVNRELESLEAALSKCLDRLSSGGRICVIAFHSLEDRIIKHALRDAAQAGTVRILTKKPLRPSQDEITMNPRSRSARLRIAEKA